MEHQQEPDYRTEDAPRRRIYHPRHPAFAILVLALGVAIWFLVRGC